MNSKEHIKIESSKRKLLKITHNLKLNSFAIQFNGADLEVHPDGADVALCVRVILDSKASMVTISCVLNKKVFSANRI